MSEKMKKYIEYLIVVLIIMTSGSSYFFAVNGKYTILLLFFITTIYNILVNKINKKNLITLICLFILLFTHYFIHLNSGIRNVDFIIILLNIFIMFCTNNTINMNKYQQYYVNIMYFLSVISLVFFVLMIFIPIESFPLVNQEGVLVYAPYHTFCWKTDLWVGQLGRNSGIFTEPGLFAGNLILAIIFCINICKKNAGKYKKCLIYLTITLITTKSTIGYISLIFLIPSIFKIFLKDWNISLNNNKGRFYLIIVVLTITPIIANILFSSSVIRDKFDTNNASFNDRSKDLQIGLDILKLNPIKGLGYYSEVVMSIEYEKGIGQNTLGLLYFSYMLGVPIVLIFLFLIFKGAYKCNVNISYCSIIIIICLNLSTQPLLIMPTYMIFMYNFRRSENVCQRMNQCI